MYYQRIGAGKTRPVLYQNALLLRKTTLREKFFRLLVEKNRLLVGFFKILSDENALILFDRTLLIAVAGRAGKLKMLMLQD